MKKNISCTLDIFSSPEQNAQWKLLGHRGVRRPSSSSVVVARRRRQQLLKRTSYHKLLGQFQPNFTGICLGWSFLKIGKNDLDPIEY